MPSFHDKLQPSPQKKLLALDGGGIRGVLTLEVLARIEKVLQEKLERGDDFVLADYFDYVAGTSTGAIIATCVSVGMRVADIQKFYLESGPAMFDKASLFDRYLHHKFEDEKLKGKLKEVVGGDTTLGSDKLRTLLMMVMRNATTDSPWPVSNNPKATFNCDPDDPGCNLKLPLWQLVRASTAAPVYFPPELIEVGRKQFIFVDGGITMYNNPSFQLFLMATLEPYNLEWPTGEDKMLIVSVGTGSNADENAQLAASDMNLVYNAKSLAPALMFAALNEQDLLCRSFGKCLAGDPIDLEIGDMIGKRGPVFPRLFTYMRYNAELTRPGLDRLGLPDVNPVNVQQLDSVQFIGDLQRVGRAVGERVKPEHFAAF
ncbi:MAG TPA: patatin-like phospholipase family protein [Thermoanaerobaculia bacterium]|nr:patatin-like phospholipase family protein [Thermoanaerobaculia bacterium]